MEYTYIYRTLEGIRETSVKQEALDNAEEEIIVRCVNEEGNIFVSII